MKKKIQYMIIDFLMLLPFAYFPGYIMHNKLDFAFEIYSIIIYLAIIYLYFRKNKFKIPKIIILVSILQLIPFIVTITYGDHSMIKHACKMLIGTICMSLLIEYNIKSREEEFIKSIMIFFGTLVTLNIFSFFIFFPSMDPTQLSFYFLGNDNGSIYETFMFIYVSLIYYSIYKSKIPIYFYLVLMFILTGYVYVKSGNGMICMMITIFFIIFYKSKLLEKLVSIKVLIPLYLLSFLIIVVFRDNPLFYGFLDLLGKSHTISGRTYIWDKCFKYILRYPILGNGYENETLVMAKLGNVKAHNVIIQYLYTGGVVGLGIFLYIIAMVLNAVKESQIKLDVKRIINFSIFLFFVISIFDYYIIKFTNIMMFLIYYFILINKKKRVSS